MAEQPSLGGAIALQGRNTAAEQLGRLQFQAAIKAGDVAAKKAALDAKRVAEIEEKFAIPKGRWNRLVLPEVLKAQAEVLDKAKTLKAERPTNWQNELENLANNYKVNMQSLETKSRELDDYETKTSVINKGNTYFTKEALKYNKAFEEATSLEDFNQRLAKLGFDPTKASDFMIRSDNSISFTPIPNQKPLETLVNAIEKFDGVTADRLQKRDQFNNLVTEEIRIRPLTYKEADEIKNNPKLADLYSKVPQLPSIEGTIDAILDSNEYFAIQYADERNLPLRRNPDGTINLQDREVIKQDLLQRVANMREPKTGRSTTYAPRGGTVVNVSPGQREEGDLGTPTYNYGVIPSYIGAPFSAYRAGELNITFEKPVPSVQYAQGEVFGPDYKPMNPGRLPNILPDGLLILLTDESGNPVPSAGATASDKAKIKGADLFMRFSSGGDVYYQKIQNYSNLGSRYSVTGKRKDQLEDRAKQMLQKASAIEADIENYKNTYVK